MIDVRCTIQDYSYYILADVSYLSIHNSIALPAGNQNPLSVTFRINKF